MKTPNGARRKKLKGASPGENLKRGAWTGNVVKKKEGEYSGVADEETTLSATMCLASSYIHKGYNRGNNDAVLLVLSECEKSHPSQIPSRTSPGSTQSLRLPKNLPPEGRSKPPLASHACASPRLLHKFPKIPPTAWNTFTTSKLMAWRAFKPSNLRPGTPSPLPTYGLESL